MLNIQIGKYIKTIRTYQKWIRIVSQWKLKTGFATEMRTNK